MVKLDFYTSNRACLQRDGISVIHVNSDTPEDESPNVPSSLQIDIPYDEIRTFCEKWGLSRMEVFGSAIRDDFDPDTSDVDLLASRPSPPTVRVSLFDEMRMIEELAAIFGRKVDLVWRSVIEEKPDKIRNRSILAHTMTIYP